MLGVNRKTHWTAFLSNEFIIPDDDVLSPGIRIRLSSVGFGIPYPVNSYEYSENPVVIPCQDETDNEQ
jgi:hypothetical protein